LLILTKKVKFLINLWGQNCDNLVAFLEFSSKYTQVQRYSDKQKYLVKGSSGQFFKNTYIILRRKCGTSPFFFNGVITKEMAVYLILGKNILLNFQVLILLFDIPVGVAITFRLGSSSVLQMSLKFWIKQGACWLFERWNLSKAELEREKIYTYNTIKFIDSSLRLAFNKDVSDGNDSETNKILRYWNW
jgi:hypothetical protein